MAELDKAAALQRRLREYPLNDTRATRDALRHDVYAYVDELRGHGWPPERVIVTVKQIARDAGVRKRGTLAASVSTEARGRLLVEIVGWCVERYYVSSTPVSLSPRQS